MGDDENDSNAYDAKLLVESIYVPYLLTFMTWFGPRREFKHL